MKQYDVVIIGSGIGGLVCGCILSMEGFSVCIVEKNKQIGGCLQTYSRDKVIFDSGVHYLGGLEKGQNLYQIFKYVDIIKHLKLQKLNEDAFDKIIIENDSNEYPFAQGYENFINQLLKFFPEEEQSLKNYCDKIKEVCEKFPLYNLRSSEDYQEKASVLEIDTKALIDSVTTNPKLRAILAGNNALYAGEPDKTPFYVHALINNSYIESSWKCINGGGQIAKYLARNILEHQGDILKNSEVKKIIEENGSITCIELTDGKKIYGKKFISNIHPKQTLQMTDTNILRNVYKKRLANLENTVSSFTLNIVLKKNSFPYSKHNYYYHKEGQVWNMQEYTEQNWPLGYAIFFSASSQSQEYADAISVLSYMKFDEVKKWENTFNTDTVNKSRGVDYESFKNEKALLLLDCVEEKFPGIKNCIQSFYAATPLSFRDYIGTDDGSLYGISKDYKDPLKTFLSPRTKLPNLYFTGQNLNLHGILGSSMSGLITCFAILGNDDLIEKIKNA